VKGQMPVNVKSGLDRNQGDEVDGCLAGKWVGEPDHPTPRCFARARMRRGKPFEGDKDRSLGEESGWSAVLVPFVTVCFDECP